jgi:aspartyl/asparaginyl-tRNA synthetase
MSTVTTIPFSSNPYVRPYESPLNFSCNEIKVIQKLREFFRSENFQEVYTDNRLSILSACEDPFNIATYEFAGLKWPHAQTGQMWLEWEMLRNPTVPGYFCLTKSNREEKNPVEGRHFVSFPLFEFEMKGNMEDLIKLEEKLLSFLGYESGLRGAYAEVAKSFSVKTLENEHETALCETNPLFYLTDFPEHTDPFWNMMRSSDDTSRKVDVIMNGQETIGSAEREVDPVVMRDRFNNIVNGEYRQRLVDEFGEERIELELNDYLSLDFFARSGGGIGVTRMTRSMIAEGLLTN